SHSVCLSVGLTDCVSNKAVCGSKELLNPSQQLISLKSFSSHHYNGGFDQKITKKEASLVLGISPTNTKSKVRDAHRRIMVLNHPGSPSVATSINAVTLGYVLGSGNTVSISFHVFG
uniref:J domain-containing protein n=1 Tax=Oncorhynchus mykiss TaxID=8022 RepID=A0A8C7P016_ONCMY